jgi:hypothetical protein
MVALTLRGDPYGMSIVQVVADPDGRLPCRAEPVGDRSPPRRAGSPSEQIQQELRRDDGDEETMTA